MLDLRVTKNLAHFTLHFESDFHADITVLAGTSGSGKSTLLKMITGFVTPDEGYIKLGDNYLFNKNKKINLNPERRRIGYVPQNYLLFPHLNVFENVAFGLRELKYSKNDIPRKVDESLNLCGILHHAARYPSELSGGEQQRVALARAIVTDPQLLLLDEPFSALDIQTRRNIRSEIRGILHSASIPSIFVTHDPIDAQAFGHQISIMEQGRLIQKGSFEQLRNRPRSRFIAEFAGLNAFIGTATAIDGNLLNISIGNETTLIATGKPVGDVIALIDPTDISLSNAPLTSSALNCLRLNVREINENSAGQWTVILRGDIDLTAHITSVSLARLKIVRGETIYAAIKATSIRVDSI